MTITLRPYQEEAIQQTFSFMADGVYKHGLIVIPTGGGKSAIMGALIRRLRELGGAGVRCLLLTHRRELIEQNFKAVLQAGVSWTDVGIYSASIGRKDRTQSVIVAQVQSLARQPTACGSFTHVLIDEAHLVPNEDVGLYRQMLDTQTNWNAAARFIGLTATPYRMGSGYLYEGDDALFEDVIYEANVADLIRDGYLCPLISRATRTTLSTEGVHTRGGEWVAGELERAVDKEALNSAIADEIVAGFKDRHHWLLFCAGVRHAVHMAEEMKKRGVRAAFITGATPKNDRIRILADFAAGRIQCLTNADVLTTGFDCPSIDAIALLRPTQSTGLMVQMVGRGFRLDPSKADTLVYDFAGNIARHGPVDAVRVKGGRTGAPDENAEPPVKACPGCLAYVPPAVRECPECGHEFPEPDRLKDVQSRPSSSPILSTTPPEREWRPVTSVMYHYHTKKSDPHAPPTLRVEYHAGMIRIASEWICFEHTGFARTKAEKWWRRRSPLPVPDTVGAAQDLAEEGELLTPTAIAVLPEGKYVRVVDYELPEATWDAFPPIPPIGVVAAPPVVQSRTTTSAEGLPRACWTCMHYRDSQDTCDLVGQPPPPEILKSGCECYAPLDEDTELAVLFDKNDRAWNDTRDDDDDTPF